MNIYLIRHGETDWNKELKIQGRIDNPLNELGRNQALTLVNRLKDIKVQHIIHSSLDRAYETYKIANQELNWNLVPEINDAFIERNFGDLEGCHTKDYYKTKDFNLINNYESDNEILERVLNGFTKLDAKKDTMIFCHSHVIKTAIIASDPVKYNYANTKLENCCIAHFEYREEQLKLKEIK